MRSSKFVALTALCLAGNCSGAWNPFKNEPAPVQDAAMPVEEASVEPHPSIEVVSAITANAPSATKAPFAPFVVPTPVDFFNGNKTLAWQRYEGQQYKIFRDRLVFRPAEYTAEGFALVALALVSVLAFFSRSGNKSRVEAWRQAHDDILRQAFSSADSNEGYITSLSTTKYHAWMTGRKGLYGLNAKFSFKPRTDLLLSTYHFIRTVLDFNYQGTQDTLVLDFILADDSEEHKADDTVLAVVTKNNMQNIKASRWDMRAFAVLSSATTTKLPQQFAIFQETSLAGENYLKNTPAVAEWLNSGEGVAHFESLVISDIGSMVQDPSEEQLASEEPLRKSRRVTLTLKLPTDVNRYKETRPALVTALNVADWLSTSKSQLLTNSDAAKIKKRRQDIIKDLAKEYIKLLADENSEKARERRKKEQEAKYAAMSKDQQKKFDELEKKRNIKKGSGQRVVSRK